MVLSVIALAAIGLALGLGSISVMSQDSGSCPAQPVGAPFTCDHAFVVDGTYVWMRPLYTGLGVASVAFLISAIALSLYLRLGNSRSKGPSTSRS